MTIQQRIGYLLEDFGARLQWFAIRHVDLAATECRWQAIILCVSLGNVIRHAGYCLVENAAHTEHLAA